MDDYRGLIPDPHLPPQTIFFDDTVIAGITPMQRGKPYDEIIDRPRGMKGYILNLTIEGEGMVRDGAQSFTCKKGDLMLFAPGVPHYYHISPAASRWYHQWIYFFPRSHWLPALSWHCKVDQVERYSLPEENFSEFSGMFWEIIRRNHSQGATSQLLSLTYLEMLLFRRQEIARQEEDLLLPASAVSDVRISLAMMFMQENMMRHDLTLEEIAAHVHLSPSRFNHVFLAAVGQSPIKWLNSQKLKTAKRLLESTELSILQVAQRSGFVDPNYFSRFFRQQTGLSPQQYRSGAEGVAGQKATDTADPKASDAAEAEAAEAKAVSASSSEA